MSTNVEREAPSYTSGKLIGFDGCFRLTISGSKCDAGRILDRDEHG